MSDNRPRQLVDRQLGPYQLLAPIGVGGMGEVYRARDHKLGRDVAVKILPPAFGNDPERLARFDREARVLAALNHPHIAAIYGVEDADGVRALVLELVDGPTVVDRLRAGPVPIAEALLIARQIAGALEAAHDKGIVHRDLKPANVMVTLDGVVKVLDFGIARMPDASSDSDAVDSAPTMIGTQEGTIVGTWAYMSPEQARGQTVDKRTDIWAFGCVLYELLAGRAVFAGETPSDTVARILEREPDWSRLPAGTPETIRRLLRRCLEKDAKRRLRDIGDARIELEEPLAPDQASSRVPERDAARRRRWVLASTGFVVAMAGALWLWMIQRAGSATPPPITRMTVTLPAGHVLDTRGGAMALAIAPTGRRLAYVVGSDRGNQLYVRDFDAFDARLIAGTDGARHPFFSPDGRSVAFFADGKLKRVSVEGGLPVAVCDAPLVARGGTWSEDGTIVFDPGVSGLMRVSAAGGNPERLTSRNPEMDARNLLWPRFLPGGRALLATVGGGMNAALALLSLDTGTWREIGRGFQAQYVESGHLLYHATAVREGELHIVPFDLTRLTVTGAPVPVLNDVFRPAAGGGAYFAAAAGGALAFARGGYAKSLVRVDRNGRRTPLLDERLGFRLPSISPDGHYVAVTIDPRPSQVWVYDLVRRSGIPLATEGHNLGPHWTPDGRRVSWGGNGSRGRASLWRVADGSSAAQLLLEGDNARSVEGWSRDGRFLLFTDAHPVHRNDLWMKPSDGDPAPLLATPANEFAARLSPDDRWLAYMSDESGSMEVYVRPFPLVRNGRWLISNGGGGFPVWSPTGRELFYLNGSAMMSVAIDATGATFRASVPELLFTGPFETGTPDFDLSPDGSFFVMVEADPDSRPTQIQVVLNWPEELKQRVPTR